MLTDRIELDIGNGARNVGRHHRRARDIYLADTRRKEHVCILARI